MAGSGIWLDDATFLQTQGQIWAQQQTQNVHAGVSWAQQAMQDALKPVQDSMARLQQMVPQVPTTPAAPVAPPPTPVAPPVEPPPSMPAPAPPVPIGGTPVATPTPAPGDLTGGIAPAPTPTLPAAVPPPPPPAPSMADVGQNWAQQQIQNLLNPSAPSSTATPAATPQPIPGLPPTTTPPSPGSASLPLPSQAQGGVPPATPATTPGAPAGPRDMPNVQVDASSPEAFVRSVTPAAQYIQDKTGIPAAAMIGMAANETGYGKAAPGNNLFGIKGSGPAGSTTSGTWEDYGNGPVQITDQFRRYDNATQSFSDFVDFLRQNPRYQNVMSLVDQGKADVGTFVQGLKDAGYMTDPNYVGKIQNIVNQWQPTIDQARQTVQGAISTGQTAVNTAVQGVQSAVAARASQFGLGLSSGDAMAFCGPTAAIAFAQTYGRNPTVAEAKQLAQQVGWDPNQGMAGVGSEVSLLKTMGVDAHATSGVDWSQVGRDASGGNPVIIDTPGHYYYVDGYNADTGQLHVGTSGTDLKGGSEWMTPDQINAMPQSHGSARAAIFADHPLAQQDGLAQSSSRSLTMGTNQPATPDLGQAAGQVLGNVPLPFVGMSANDLTSLLGQNAQQLQTGRDIVGGLLSPDSSVSRPLRAKADSILQAVQDVGSQATQAGQDLLQQGQQALQQAPQTIGDILQQNALTSQGIPNIGGNLLEGAGQLGQNLSVQNMASNPLMPSNLLSGAEQGLGQNVVGPAINALLPGGALEQGRQALGGAIAGSMPDMPVLGGVTQAAGGMLAAPSVIEQMQTMQELSQKYAPGGLFPDPSTMTPEDAERWNSATMAIAGTVGPPETHGRAGVPPPPPGSAARMDWLLDRGKFAPPETQTPGLLSTIGRSIQAGRIGALAGGIPTVAHIAFNAPVQIGLKLLSDVPASVLSGHAEAVGPELYGAMQGLRSWALNASQTLRQPGPLAESMGGGTGAQALETGLTGLVRAHPVLQDAARQLATSADLWKTAAMEATNRGYAPNTSAWQARVADLVSNPTDAMTTSAQHAGDRAALSGAMGTTGQTLADAIKKAPVLRFFAPIFNVGYHVASQGLETSPLGLVGTGLDVARAAVGEGPYAGAEGFAGRGGAGAVTPLAERFRNNLIGVGLAAGAYMAAGQGLITGEGPSDPRQQAALRDTGWQPDSIKIGGRYFNAHLLGPVGWSLIQGANAYEATHTPEEGGALKPILTPQGARAPGPQDILGDLVARQARYFNNETFLNGVGSVLNALSASAQGGQMATREAESVIQSFIPQGALLANAASAMDPYERQARGSTAQETFGQALETRLPGLRQNVPPRLTATGAPIPNPQQGAGLLMPRSSVVNADPVLVAMAQAGVTPSAAPSSVPYGPYSEIRLTPQEQQAWEQYRGQIVARSAGNLVASPNFQQLPPKTQQVNLQRINTIADDAAGKMVLRDIMLGGPAAAQGRSMPTGLAAPVYSYAPMGLGDQSMLYRNQAQHQALMQSLLGP